MTLAKKIFEDAMQIFEKYGKKSDDNEDQDLPF
jgi:hypothetical protein